MYWLARKFMSSGRRAVQAYLKIIHLALRRRMHSNKMMPLFHLPVILSWVKQSTPAYLFLGGQVIPISAAIYFHLISGHMVPQSSHPASNGAISRQGRLRGE